MAAVLGLFCLLLTAFGREETAITEPSDPPKLQEEGETAGLRRQMVGTQIAARGITDNSVLEAMRTIPRHLFMPDAMRDQAYGDHPVPIGEGQTISQPYIVALMTESLALKRSSRVLEIGTGSGYQAAILSQVAGEVFSIEIRKVLHERATKVLADLGLSNVKTKLGDGYHGWEKHAPFDAIIITAAISHIPPPLLNQLAEGGKMILPLGEPYGVQQLVLILNDGSPPKIKHITGVLFVPMTGKALE